MGCGQEEHARINALQFQKTQQKQTLLTRWLNNRLQRQGHGKWPTVESSFMLSAC